MLDIVSVCYNDEKLLSLNYYLTTSFNDMAIQWIIVQNSKFIPAEKRKDITVLPGVPKRIRTKPPWQSSFQHGDSLNTTNSIIKNSPNKWVLYLDPDFFIIPPLSLIIKNCLDKDLAFFGAPYNWYCYDAKEKEFPVCFCLLVNKEKIDVESLDFRPGWGKFPKTPETDYPDASFSIYKTYKSKEKYEGVLPLPKGSLEYIYSIENQKVERQYIWKNCAFAIHDFRSSLKTIYNFVEEIRDRDGEFYSSLESSLTSSTTDSVSTTTSSCL